MSSLLVIFREQWSNGSTVRPCLPIIGRVLFYGFHCENTYRSFSCLLVNPAHRWDFSLGEIGIGSLSINRNRETIAVPLTCAHFVLFGLSLQAKEAEGAENAVMLLTHLGAFINELQDERVRGHELKSTPL